MQYYNIYFKGKKINKTVLNEDDINVIKEKTVIYKKQINGDTLRINTKDLQYRNCIVI